jgi:hypothetical protein
MLSSSVLGTGPSYRGMRQYLVHPPDHRSSERRQNRAYLNIERKHCQRTSFLLTNLEALFTFGILLSNLKIPYNPFREK